jgi:hypothetical protein
MLLLQCQWLHKNIEYAQLALWNHLGLIRGNILITGSLGRHVKWDALFCLHGDREDALPRCRGRQLKGACANRKRLLVFYVQSHKIS